MQAVQQRQAAARSEQVQYGHGAGNVKLAANAGCCVAERKHGCANGARRAECSAFRQSEMRLSADAGLLHQFKRLRKRAVHGGASVAAQMEPFRAECSAFRLSGMQIEGDGFFS